MYTHYVHVHAFVHVEIPYEYLLVGTVYEYSRWVPYYGILYRACLPGIHTMGINSYEYTAKNLRE